MKRVLETAALTMLLTLIPASALLAGNGSQHEPIKLDLRDAELGNVMRTFSDMIRSELELDPKLTAVKVSIGVEGVSWMTALDVICESAGCDWRLAGGNPRVLMVTAGKPLPENGSQLDQRISMQLEDADIKDVLKTFSKLSEREVDFEGNPQGSVSFHFVDVTARTALNAICESVGCHWEIDEQGILRVVVASARESSISIEEASNLLAVPIDMSLESADAVSVFKTFGKLLGCPMVIDHEVSGKITVEINQMPATDALTELCAQVACQWSLTSQDGAAVIMIGAE
jgi:type II secretory pathway component GspD/PulD (secretin)